MNDNIYYPWRPVNVLPCGVGRGFVPHHNWYDNYYPVMPHIGFNPGMFGGGPPQWIPPSYDGRKMKSPWMTRAHYNSRNGSEVSVSENLTSQEGTKDNQKTGWVPKKSWNSKTSQGMFSFALVCSIVGFVVSICSFI